MGRSEPSWISLTTTQQSELQPFDLTAGWQVLSHQSIPTVFPEPFRNKLDSAVVISAPTSSGGTWLVFNALRPDRRAGQIDQEPFAIIIHSTGADPSGMFLHHGKWRGRSQKPPDGFWAHVDESGIGNYFLANPPSELTQGPLDQLPAGHREAFESATMHYRSSRGGS